MPATLRIKGKDQRPTATAMMLPLPEGESLAKLHEAFTVLYYEGGEWMDWRQECDTLARRIERRGTKLDDPTLADNPGRAKALREWHQWRWQLHCLTESIRVRGLSLRAKALWIDYLWTQFRPETQQEILDGQRRCSPETRDMLPLLPNVDGHPHVTELESWKELLSVWAADFERCPF